METIRLYSKYVRMRQARRKRGEKRKSVSGIKTGKIPGKIPGNFPGNPTGIIPVPIPRGARTPRVSRPFPKAGVSYFPLPPLVRRDLCSAGMTDSNAGGNPGGILSRTRRRLPYRFFTSATPLPHLPSHPSHLCHIRKVPTGLSGCAKKPSGSRNLSPGGTRMS